MSEEVKNEAENIQETESAPVEPAQAPVTRKSAAAKKVGKTYFWGTGRRKSSVARVRVRPGNGVFQVNGREMKEYFPIDRLRQQAMSPLAATSLSGKVDVLVNVRGGGTTGQVGAVILGISRALLEMDDSTEAVLRADGFMTRDARKVERKKYGRAKARKSFQFSKR